MVQPRPDPPRGILNPGSRDSASASHARFWPDGDLAPFVEHFWTVAWDNAEPQVHEVLPHPSVHLVFERGRSRVVGVQTGRFTARLAGRGRILGVKFRPGGFRPFINHAVAELTERTYPPVDVLGMEPEAIEREAFANDDPEQAFEVIQAALRCRLPSEDPEAARIDRIVRHAASHREVLRAEQLAASFDIGLRQLQRLFHDYVGVNPKWVIQRYRIHEALARIDSGEPINWAELALELGWSDQAHFTRDFRKLVGRTPTQYVTGDG